MASRNIEPNRRLAKLMEEAGFSNKGLASRVVRLGKVRGAPHLRYNHSSVARWLRGEQPRRPVPQIIAEIFTIELGRRITAADIGMSAPVVPPDIGLELPTSRSACVQVASQLWRADAEQQRLLVDADFDPTAFASAALGWLVGPWDSQPTPAAGRRIGTADVEEIRQVTNAFRILDNRLGGGHVRGPVVEYLNTHVAPLLRDGRCTEEVRPQFFAAVADLTKLAAWLYHDMDKQGLAQRYLIQALALAKVADDYGLAGEILAAMSQQAQYVAQSRRAVELARAAQSAAQRAGMPVLLTECQVMEAHGYAAQQEARACALALTRAEKSYERAADTEMPAWLDYFDEAYFAAKIAHCFRELGRGEETEQYALRSLDMDPSYRRGKTFNIAVLGTALALQGKVDEACAHVRTAIDMAVALTSSRVYRYIGDACRALSPYAAEPDVRELMEYAEDRLPDLRVREERP
ncbi:hypothetical protein Arub01_46980 [Actinomadura rubrobrunea]|uniref:Transcriptional regulator n=1 Tax=Actinomadura rubrobrunea TaxID=115335 RepID=A0A9W6UWQ5_9ACTN|nr:hypothetical protein [Actinomadura rubrobrunea]GLW66454.1 hypothetical protein Arub01_46980 [Actinomadura rubrobrunea]